MYTTNTKNSFSGHQSSLNPQSLMDYVLLECEEEVGGMGFSHFLSIAAKDHVLQKKKLEFIVRPFLSNLRDTKNGSFSVFQAIECV